MTENSSEMERAIGRLEGKLDAVLTTIADLKGAFDTMEKGRLTALEVKFATLETVVSAKAKNAAVYAALLSAVVASVASAVIVKFVIG